MKRNTKVLSAGSDKGYFLEGQPWPALIYFTEIYKYISVKYISVFSELSVDVFGFRKVHKKELKHSDRRYSNVSLILLFRFRGFIAKRCCILEKKVVNFDTSIVDFFVNMEQKWRKDVFS